MGPKQAVARRVRQIALRGALVAAAVGALFLAGLLSPGATQGNQNFSAAGVFRLAIFYRAVCLPGELDASSGITAAETISGTSQKIISLVNGGDVFGCLGTDDNPGSNIEDGPTTVVIDQELFDAANIAAELTADITAGQNDFHMTVQNLTEDGSRATGQSDWPSRFPDNGFVYVEEELMQYSHKHADSLHIVARGVTRPDGTPTAAEAHQGPRQGTSGPLPGNFVRLQGKLKLVDRKQPAYADGKVEDLGGATTAAAHAAGATVQSPLTYLTCRVRTDQTDVPAGPDTLLSRSRCYQRLEPDGAWPDPYTGPLLALSPIFYHGITTGTIDDEANAATTTTSSVTDVLGLQCFPFVEDHLWVKITNAVTVDKDPNNKSSGQFRISVYLNSACTPPAVSVFGGADGNNMSFTPIAETTDTDGDGCTDKRELSGNRGLGGQRDPYNPYDFFDPDKNRAISTTDVFAVAAKFGRQQGQPGYSAQHDRGGFVPDADGKDDPASLLDGNGPSTWNQKGPDGAIATGDVFAAAAQFGHTCL